MQQCLFPKERMHSPVRRLAFFLAVDTYGHYATVMRALAYLLPWYMLAFPRAPLWRLALPCAGMVYACTGLAYLLSLVLRPPCLNARLWGHSIAMRMAIVPAPLASCALYACLAPSVALMRDR